MEGLVGMTGGEMRMPKLDLMTYEKEMIKNTMRASGLKLVE